MTDKPDNPPAFPTLIEHTEFGNQEIRQQTQGMTLRDYFAAAALQGILSNEALAIQIKKEIGEFELSMETTCRISFDVADAMLKARQ